MKVLIICGETSANMYGAELAKVLQRKGHQIHSIGDHQLAAVSHQWLAIDASYHRIDIGQFKFKRDLISSIRTTIKKISNDINMAILVDFPGYNFKIAKILNQHDIPIYTYITPNFWLWNQKKMARKLAAYSQKIIAIFEKEHQFYLSLSPSKAVGYFGHPITLKGVNPRFQMSSPHAIGIFPGSRRAEIIHHLPIMARIIKQFNASYSCSIICENPSLHDLINAILSPFNLTHVPIQSELNNNLCYAITAPGTNTLQLVLMGVPTTIIGKLNQWMYFFARYILRIKIDYIGTPNIILNTSVCPEYIHPTPSDEKRLVEEVKLILNSPSKIKEIQDHYSIIRSKMKAPKDYYEKVVEFIMST